MTDPLRPFADIIRALWRSRTQANSAPATSSTAAAPAVRASVDAARARRPARSLPSHLKSRIAACSGASRARLRETFVETVLLWELGEQLAPDPAFIELVTQVSAQLASDPAVGSRLDQLLEKLSAA